MEKIAIVIGIEELKVVILTPTPDATQVPRFIGSVASTS